KVGSMNLGPRASRPQSLTDTVRRGMSPNVPELYSPVRAGRPRSQEEAYMLPITDAIAIPDDELEWSFARSGGPGGQNVNKVASKAVLRWKAATSTAPIPPAARERM